MKLGLVCALALGGVSVVNGPALSASAEFRCAANLPSSLDRIAVFGNYTADATGGAYGLMGPLDVAALDGDLHDVDGERRIGHWSTTLGSFDQAGAACSHATAVDRRAGASPCAFKAIVSDGRGSSITVTKPEGHAEGARIDVDLKAAYGMGAYVQHFPNASCVFKFRK